MLWFWQGYHPLEAGVEAVSRDSAMSLQASASRLPMLRAGSCLVAVKAALQRLLAASREGSWNRPTIGRH